GHATVIPPSHSHTKSLQAGSSTRRYRAERRQAALELPCRAPRGAGRLPVGRVGFSSRLNCFASTGKKLLTAETRQGFAKVAKKAPCDVASSSEYLWSVVFLRDVRAVIFAFFSVYCVCFPQL